MESAPTRPVRHNRWEHSCDFLLILFVRFLRSARVYLSIMKFYRHCHLFGYGEKAVGSVVCKRRASYNIDCYNSSRCDESKMFCKRTTRISVHLLFLTIMFPERLRKIEIIANRSTEIDKCFIRLSTGQIGTNCSHELPAIRLFSTSPKLNFTLYFIILSSKNIGFI